MAWPLVLDIAEAVTADHRSTVHDDAGSRRHPSRTTIGVEEAVVPDDAVVPDEDAGIQCHSRADGHAIAQVTRAKSRRRSDCHAVTPRVMPSAIPRIRAGRAKTVARLARRHRPGCPARFVAKGSRRSAVQLIMRRW